MAARFSQISSEEIGKFAEKVVNKNTVKTTKTWMNVWKSLAESKGVNDGIVYCKSKELDEYLSGFIAEIRKSDDFDYKPDSLRVMLAIGVRAGRGFGAVAIPPPPPTTTTTKWRQLRFGNKRNFFQRVI